MTNVGRVGGSVGSRIREVFSFARARAELRELGPETVAALTRTFALAEQRRAAAEALHFQGHRAESLRLVKQAFAGAAEAASAYAERLPEATDDTPALVRALLARGASRAAADAVLASLDTTNALVVADLDSEVVLENDDAFVRALDGTESILVAFELVGSTEAALVGKGRLRIAGVVGFALVAIVGVAFLTHVPEGLRAEARASLWNNFGAELAVDGRDDTWFLAPDGEPATLDVYVSPTKRVNHVTLLNTVNAPYNDRSTKDYALEILSGGRVVKRIPGSFEYTLTPTRVVIPVGVDRVDHIRIQLINHHRTGAGLSEVSVD